MKRLSQKNSLNIILKMEDPRYKKFEHYFSNIKKIKIYDKLWNSFKKLFRSSKEKFNYNSICPGIIHVLKYLNNKKIDCFIVSGGDQKELEYVFKKETF